MVMSAAEMQNRQWRTDDEELEPSDCTAAAGSSCSPVIKWIITVKNVQIVEFEKYKTIYIWTFAHTHMTIYFIMKGVTKVNDTSTSHEYILIFLVIHFIYKTEKFPLFTVCGSCHK